MKIILSEDLKNKIKCIYQVFLFFSCFVGVGIALLGIGKLTYLILEYFNYLHIFDKEIPIDDYHSFVGLGFLVTSLLIFLFGFFYMLFSYVFSFFKYLEKNIKITYN